MKKGVFRRFKRYKSPTSKLSAMKSYLIVVLILFHLSLTATNSPTSTRLLSTIDSVTKVDAKSSIVQAVEANLVNHIWESEEGTFLFNAKGVVSQIQQNNHLHAQWWNVYAENGKAYLKLYSKSGETIYQIATDDKTNWIVLSNNQVLAMKATPIKEATTRTTAMQNLVGTWSSTMYPSNLIEDLEAVRKKSITSVDFRYAISQDGTFHKTLSVNGKLHQEMKGIWQLSADGNYFILHFDKGDHSFQTYIVKVKHLSWDELVLDEALVTCALESELCGKMETFFFNKR